MTTAAHSPVLTRPARHTARLTALLTSHGRAAVPFRRRVGAAFAVVVLLHLVGLGLLLMGLSVGASGSGGVIPLGIVGLAYLRGLVHSFDFDHIAMIDNSTRKFVAEGRDPASVGLAFSLKHSTVVVATGVLVIAGAGFIRTALDESSETAQVLGVIGVCISGIYLLLVAVANAATFAQAWRLRRALRRDPATPVPAEALTPRGPAARIMTLPLARVRQPWHVYVIGFLFSLGFDTSSQIGVLVLTAGAALAGAPLISLLCLPVLFTAAMTLGDTINGLMMLKMYSAAQLDPARKITYNLIVTGLGIFAALAVGLLAAAGLLTEEVGVASGALQAVAAVNTEYAGYALAGVFGAIFAVSAMVWRRSASKRSVSVEPAARHRTAMPCRARFASLVGCRDFRGRRRTTRSLREAGVLHASATLCPFALALERSVIDGPTLLSK